MSTKKIVLSVAGALLVLSASPMIGKPATSPTLVQHQSEQPSKTFSGTIIKDGENFVLNDAANKTSYMLDDAQKASPYEGKKVKGTGTVEVASNTINVENHEKAS